MPNLARLAAAGEVGRAATIPDGLPPGSDVGNMAILGYDPARYHTGRAPIEAAAMGIDLQPGQVAYRCNLVTLDDSDQHHGRLLGPPHRHRAVDADHRGRRRRTGRRPRRAVVPPRRHVPPRDGGPGRAGQGRLRAAPRPHRQAGGPARRPGGGRAAPDHGGLEGDRAGQGRRARRRRHPGVAVGPGHPPDAPVVRVEVGPHRAAGHGRRPHPGPRRPLGDRPRRSRGRHRLLRHRTTRGSATPAWPRWPTGTSS